MAPHTMKPGVGLVCRGRMHSRRWPSPGIRRTRTRPSLAYRQNLLLSLKTTRVPFHSPVDLSRCQNSRAWRRRGVGGNLVRGTHELSPAASRRFPMVLGHTAGATCDRVSSLDAVRAATAARTMCRSWRASVLYGRPVPGLRTWECSRNTGGSSDTPPIHCTQYV